MWHMYCSPLYRSPVAVVVFHANSEFFLPFMSCDVRLPMRYCKPSVESQKMFTAICRR
ncbi:hypothetical protein M3J09_008308 [Ascochyta lentis]